MPASDRLCAGAVPLSQLRSQLSACITVLTSFVASLPASISPSNGWPYHTPLAWKGQAQGSTRLSRPLIP